MASISKIEYLKRYMSKEDREDFKMKRKIKQKLLSDIEKQKTAGINGPSTTSTGKVPTGLKKSEGKSSVSSKSVLKRRHDSDSDESQPRKPPSGPESRKRHDSDSDQSPSLKHSSVIGKMRHDSDSDPSPTLTKPSVTSKKRHVSDSDQSPPRKNSCVPSNKRHDSSDSDQSPPRKNSAVIGKRRHDSDSDQSPLRKNLSVTSSRRHDSDLDQSPPRKNSSSAGQHATDSDQSPPRPTKRGARPSRFADVSPPRHTKRGARPSRFADVSPPPSVDGGKAKATKTMSGATAGLASATEMRREARILKDKENSSFHKIDDEILGRNAKTVMRDKETGKRRNLQSEREDEEEKEKKEEEQKAKYQQWGKGLSQQEEKERRLADQIHEASKPLARYKDDQDLDEMLKKEERAEDPMLAFIRRKKVKEDAKNGSKEKSKKELPKYKGPTAPPPNRYNILPGYRWDGVDRSNGFENKIFASINNKKAVSEMAYKWSTEDM